MSGHKSSRTFKKSVIIPVNRCKYDRGTKSSFNVLPGSSLNSNLELCRYDFHSVAYSFQHVHLQHIKRFSKNKFGSIGLDGQNFFSYTPPDPSLGSWMLKNFGSATLLRHSS